MMDRRGLLIDIGMFDFYFGKKIYKKIKSETRKMMETVLWKQGDMTMVSLIMGSLSPRL